MCVFRYKNYVENHSIYNLSFIVFTKKYLMKTTYTEKKLIHYLRAKMIEN
jgi:hypothetical protein